MARFVEDQDIESSDSPLTLNRSRLLNSKEDEVDQVVNAINERNSRITYYLNDRRQAENALRDSEEKLLEEKQFSDKLIGSFPGTFCLFNENDRLIWWNKEHEIATGYSAEELLNKHVEEFFAEPDLQLVQQEKARGFVDGMKPLEADLLSKDGSKTRYLFKVSDMVFFY